MIQCQNRHHTLKLWSASNVIEHDNIYYTVYILVAVEVAFWISRKKNNSNKLKAFILKGFSVIDYRVSHRYINV